MGGWFNRLSFRGYVAHNTEQLVNLCEAIPTGRPLAPVLLYAARKVTQKYYTQQSKAHVK